jgi:hypothetical protein
MNNIKKMEQLVIGYIKSSRNNGASDAELIGELSAQLSWALCSDEAYRKVVIECMEERLEQGD